MIDRWCFSFESLGVPVGEAYGVVLDLEGRPLLRRAGMARLGELLMCERAIREFWYKSYSPRVIFGSFTREKRPEARARRVVGGWLGLQVSEFCQRSQIRGRT